MRSRSGSEASETQQTIPMQPEPDPFGEAEADLSAWIDRAESQLQAATDPAVQAAWRRILAELTDLLPARVGEPDR